MASTGSSSNPNLEIIVERNPSESRISELGINSGPKWSCPPGKQKLKFEARQTCYFLQGRVKVYKGSPESEAVEFSAGDLVFIPKGLSCTWDVSVHVDAFYKFDPS